MAEQRPGGSGERSPAQETSRQGREKMGEAEHYLEDTIRTKPLQSVLLAAGVGLLIALLWRR